MFFKYLQALFLGSLFLGSGYTNVDAQTDKTPNIKEMKKQWEVSAKVWEKRRDEWNGNYSFVLHCSGGEGPSHKMQVWIEDNQVAKTVSSVIDWDNNVLSVDSSLQKTFNGVPVVAIDQIYVYAYETVFNANSKENYIYFDFDKDGIVRTAGTYPIGLMDACMDGYSITDLQAFRPKMIDDKGLYGTWHLLEITKEGKTTNYVNYDVKGSAENFFVTFEKGRSFRYNLDANSCWDSFKLKPNGGIKFGDGYSSATCTELCCDEVYLGYTGANRYKIEGNKLYLYGYNETFVLEKATE